MKKKKRKRHEKNVDAKFFELPGNRSSPIDNAIILVRIAFRCLFYFCSCTGCPWFFFSFLSVCAIFHVFNFYISRSKLMLFGSESKAAKQWNNINNEIKRKQMEHSDSMAFKWWYWRDFYFCFHEDWRSSDGIQISADEAQHEHATFPLWCSFHFREVESISNLCG